jgi:hypothetical protein
MTRVEWTLLVNVAFFGGEAAAWAMAGPTAAAAYGAGLLVGLLLVLAYLYAGRARSRP